MTVRRLLEEYPMRNVAVLEHRYASWMRDYEVEVEAAWSEEQQGRYLYRFRHCPVAHVVSRLGDDVWRQSWPDVYTDHGAWVEAGEPEGFVWGMRWSFAKPGLSHVETSEQAKAWSQRLGKTMHEVKIETDVYQLRLIFHSLIVRKVSDELLILDPATLSALQA
ncbi:MAG: hypothetical protein M3068_02475 [Gemmatimonadota bacterium]|nr:hypothetical protein [Gemmatimonadota bacterium]